MKDGREPIEPGCRGIECVAGVVRALYGGPPATCSVLARRRLMAGAVWGQSMRLIWTGERSPSEARHTLQARGYDPAQLGLSEQAVCRIDRRFPVLISQSGRFIEEAFSFLSDVAFVRGSTRSTRTLETYAESLLSWLAYAERKGLHWRRPTPVMLAGYRDYLLGTDGADRRGARALSRRTVNLRAAGLPSSRTNPPSVIRSACRARSVERGAGRTQSCRVGTDFELTPFARAPHRHSSRRCPAPRSDQANRKAYRQ